jgi:hypothetical protein
MADKYINELFPISQIGSYAYADIPVYDASEASSEKLKRTLAIHCGIPIYNIGSPDINMVLMNGVTAPVVRPAGMPSGGRARVSVRDFLVSIHLDTPRTLTYGIKKSGPGAWTLSNNPMLPYVQYDNSADLGVNLILIKLSYTDESEVEHQTIGETYFFITDPQGYLP